MHTEKLRRLLGVERPHNVDGDLSKQRKTDGKKVGKSTLMARPGGRVEGGRIGGKGE